MKKFLVSLIIVCTGSLISLIAWADTLEMKDGRLLEGEYMGGTQQTIRFQTGDTVAVYQVKDVLAVTFSVTSSPVSQATPLPKSPPLSQRQLKEVTIAAGTSLPVRMADTMDITTAQQDDWFKATLDADLVADGVVIAPKGSTVNGQVVRAEQGRQESVLTITLQELLVNQQSIPITTTAYTMRTKSQAVFDMNSLKISPRSRGPLQIPNQTLIEFKTTEPVRLVLSQFSPVTPLPKSTPLSQRQPKEVTIAAGTALPVRMVDAVDITTAQQDDWFRAALDADLVVDGILIAPKGSAVNGQVVRAEQGRQESVLTITLQELLVNQQSIPITTTAYAVKEKPQTLFGTDSLKIVTRNRSLRIPEQTVIEFKTTEPVKINVSK